MYAYLQYNPKSKWSKGERPHIYEPRKPEDGPRWREEDWSIGERLFTHEKSLSHMSAGASFPHTSTTTVYDARIVSPESETHLKDIDARIMALRREYQQHVDEHFREWVPISQTDCVRTVVAKFKSEKDARRAMGPPPKVTAEQRTRERRFNDSLAGL